MHMTNLGAALKRLPPETVDRVKLVFVTTDPARDKPVVLRKWLNHFDTHFVGLTGTEAAIETVQRVTGVPVAQKAALRTGGYSVSHANFMVAYTRDNLAHVIYPGGVNTDDWVHDLPLLVREDWARQTRLDR